MKNLHAFIGSKTPKSLVDKTSAAATLSDNHIFTDFLDDLKKFSTTVLTRSNNTALKKPCDHKKRSVMTLFRTPRKRLTSSIADYTNNSGGDKIEALNNAVFADA